MTLLLSIDPAAETAVSDTGWVLLRYDDNTPATFVDGGVVHGGFDGFRTWAMPDSDVTVCEKYIKFRAQGDPTPLLIEGVVRYLRPSVALQPASGKNTAVSNDVLKALGLYSTTGHHSDQREAARHGVWYLKKTAHEPTLLAGWPGLRTGRSSAPR